MNKLQINLHINIIQYWLILYRLEVLSEDFDLATYVFKFKIGRITKIGSKRYYPGTYLMKISSDYATVYINKVNGV